MDNHKHCKLCGELIERLQFDAEGYECYRIGICKICIFNKGIETINKKEKK